MDVAYKRRGIHGNISMPFYRKPKPIAPLAPPLQTISKAVKPTPPEVKPNKKEVAGVDVHVEKSIGVDTSSEVDLRAATYIKSVQERFKRERIFDEEHRRKH